MFVSQDEHDMEGMSRSAETVYKLIRGEVRAGIPSERIMIGGFSQGQSCIALLPEFIWQFAEGVISHTRRFNASSIPLRTK